MPSEKVLVRGQGCSAGGRRGGTPSTGVAEVSGTAASSLSVPAKSACSASLSNSGSPSFEVKWLKNPPGFLSSRPQLQYRY